VLNLKAAIKRKISSDFNETAEDQFTLWRVRIPDENKVLLKDKIRQEVTEDDVVISEEVDIIRSDESSYPMEQLSPTRNTVGSFFSEKLAAGHVHIFVQPPSSGNATHWSMQEFQQCRPRAFIALLCEHKRILTLRC